MNELIKKLGEKVKSQEATWGEVAQEVNQAFDSDLSSNAVRKRYYRIMKAEKNPKPVNVNQGEYETLYGDGTVEAQKIVNLSPSEKASPDLVKKQVLI